MMTAKHYKIPMAWGLLHGVNDWVAGYMIIHYSQSHSLEQNSLALVIYTILGFGGQLPAGMWIDKHRNINPFISLSVFLLVTSVVCFWISDLGGIIVAGFSSAFLHVTGGSMCLRANEGKTGSLGVFTAPGVLGLTAGLASGTLSSGWLVLAIIAVLLILLLFRIRLSEEGGLPVQSQPASQLIEGHDWIMIALLLTVTMRSLLYEVISVFAHHWQSGVLTLGIAAFAGKSSAAGWQISSAGGAGSISHCHWLSCFSSSDRATC